MAPFNAASSSAMVIWQLTGKIAPLTVYVNEPSSNICSAVAVD